MTTSKQVVFSPEANPPLPFYCTCEPNAIAECDDPIHRYPAQAIISNGFVFVAGNVGCDRDTKLIEGGIRVETRAALENIKKVLKAAGTSLENVIKVNIFISDFDSFQAMNEVYAEYFKPGTALPARTCVQVAVLPLKAAVEIECVAALPVES